MVRFNVIVLHRSIYVVHVNFAVVQTQLHYPANIAMPGKTDANAVG